MGEVPRRPLYSRYRRKSGSNSDIVKPTRMVESRCGAVALGRTYLLPPLSSGGALMVLPWLRFHIPLIGRVEGWRAGVARGSRPTPRLQPPPRRTQRADFPHCAPPFTSRQSLWDLSCWGDFRPVASHSISVEQP